MIAATKPRFNARNLTYGRIQPCNETGNILTDYPATDGSWRPSTRRSIDAASWFGVAARRFLSCRVRRHHELLFCTFHTFDQIFSDGGGTTAVISFAIHHLQGRTTSKIPGTLPFCMLLKASVDICCDPGVEGIIRTANHIDRPSQKRICCRCVCHIIRNRQATAAPPAELHPPGPSGYRQPKHHEASRTPSGADDPCLSPQKSRSAASTLQHAVPHRTPEKMSRQA